MDTRIGGGSKPKGPGVFRIQSYGLRAQGSASESLKGLKGLVPEPCLFGLSLSAACGGLCGCCVSLNIPEAPPRPTEGLLSPPGA